MFISLLDTLYVNEREFGEALLIEWAEIFMLISALQTL